MRAADEGRQLLLLEELGDDLLAAVIARGGDEGELYGLALEAILRFQAAEPPAWLEPLDATGLLRLLDMYLDEAVGPLSADAIGDLLKRNVDWNELATVGGTAVSTAA